MNGKKVAFSQDVHSPDYTGTFAQYIVLPATGVVPMPDTVEYNDICAAFVNPLTVCGFIDVAKKNGHKAIIHAAAASSLGK